MSNYVSQCKDININTKYNIRGKYCKSYKYVPRHTIKYLKKKKHTRRVFLLGSIIIEHLGLMCLKVQGHCNDFYLFSKSLLNPARSCP